MSNHLFFRDYGFMRYFGLEIDYWRQVHVIVPLAPPRFSACLSSAASALTVWLTYTLYYILLNFFEIKIEGNDSAFATLE